MHHDQVVLGIHCRLHVVADDAGSPAVGRHRAGVRIGQRDLLVRRGLDRDVHLAKVLHLLFQADELVLQTHFFGFRTLAFLPVGRVQRRHVPGDVCIDLLDPPLDGSLCVVLVARVHRLEAASVDGHHGLGEQVELAAEQDELPARGLDRRSVVTPEVGNGLEVRHQPTSQPHQLDVALGFPFQPPA